MISRMTKLVLLLTCVSVVAGGAVAGGGGVSVVAGGVSVAGGGGVSVVAGGVSVAGGGGVSVVAGGGACAAGGGGVSVVAGGISVVSPSPAGGGGIVGQLPLASGVEPSGHDWNDKDCAYEGRSTDDGDCTVRIAAVTRIILIIIIDSLPFISVISF
jgi:hypothetical protein